MSQPITKPTALIVDDDGDIREALGFMLECEGITVTTARNGADAIAQLRAGLRPAVVLLDLHMPEMNGAEFCAEVSRDPALAGTRIVVVSGQLEGSALEASPQVVARLEKPVEVARVIEIVREAR